MASVTNVGRTLDATFAIKEGDGDQRFTITINSGSGSTGARRGLNVDYKRGFDLILVRIPTM
jgi:hypothetical protein